MEKQADDKESKSSDGWFAKMLPSSKNDHSDTSAIDSNVDCEDKEPTKVSRILSPSDVGNHASAPRPVGQLALHFLTIDKSPPPAVRSYLGRERRTYREAESTVEYFPSSYAPEDTVLGHLRFALAYEPLDLSVVHAALCLLGPERLTEWVKDEPEGRESRRAWFFYETLTGDTLPVEDAQKGDFVDALSEEFHYVAFPRDSSRHRVRDNLLGTGSLCPTLRLTPKLEAARARRLNDEARLFSTGYPPEILTRVVNSLVSKEVSSTYALEGEVFHRNQNEGFLRALGSLSEFDPTDKSKLIGLQNAIVEPKNRAGDWRDFQNYVGGLTRHGYDYETKVSFVCPHPEDVSYLMDGWTALTDRLCREKGGTVDAVSAAAAISFAFVFIHPFVDGNGRIHRFLILHVLQKLGFTPTNAFLPVSASILREPRLYEAALEAFSKRVTTATVWEFREKDSVNVLNETRNLFRFFDATPQAEYLYDRIANTILQDFKKELDDLVAFDAVYEAVQKVVRLSDKKTKLLVRLLLQHGGRLSKNKSCRFRDLSESEIAAIEKEVSLFFRDSDQAR